MDQNATVLEVHSALNVNRRADVAKALASMHPVILGELLLAVDEAYELRTPAGHPDYEDAVSKLARKHKVKG